MESFVYGENPPDWFVAKVQSMDVEEYEGSCRFYSVRGREIEKLKGQRVYKIDLYGGKRNGTG